MEQGRHAEWDRGCRRGRDRRGAPRRADRGDEVGESVADEDNRQAAASGRPRWRRRTSLTNCGLLKPAAMIT
jgi:hypothetical protein